MTGILTEQAYRYATDKVGLGWAAGMAQWAGPTFCKCQARAVQGSENWGLCTSLAGTMFSQWRYQSCSAFQSISHKSSVTGIVWTLWGIRLPLFPKLLFAFSISLHGKYNNAAVLWPPYLWELYRSGAYTSSSEEMDEAGSSNLCSHTSLKNKPTNKKTLD